MRQPGWRRRAINIAELRRLARRRLPRMVFDMADGGAEDEITLRRNEADLADIELLPAPLAGAPNRNQSVELFDTTLSSPVILGPTGLAGLLWPRGELAAARAAAASGSIYVASHGATCTFEDIARAGDGPKWLQVFLLRDRGVTRAFVERGQAAGYKALVLTIDNQMPGWRERDIRNGMALPPRITPRNALDMARHARWLLRIARTPNLTFVNYARPGEADLRSLGAYMWSLLDPAVSWTDFDWLRALWSGPLLVKGVLHPREAAEAVRRGADGLIVSNHGGRQLDGSVSSIRALPAVVEAVGGAVPVLVDGGFRRGVDVVKAIALGARACLIARPHLWGLAVGGQAGVEWVVEIFRRDIDRVLGLGGWDSFAALDRGVLRLRAGDLTRPPAA